MGYSPWGFKAPALSGRLPGLPGMPQDVAGLTRKFETSPVGGPTCRKTPISLSALEKPLRGEGSCGGGGAPRDSAGAPSPLLIATVEAIPLRGLEGVPDLHGPRG